MSVKSVLIVVLLLFLLTLCFKCVMLEQFETHVSGPVNELSVAIVNQKQDGSHSPSGVGSYGALSRLINYRQSTTPTESTE